jgi:putative FmdB family regulatory protein
MPIYEYQCPKCDQIFEQFVCTNSAGESTQVTCGRCGTVVLKKISLSNFHLKGSGWARDGYKKE